MPDLFKLCVMFVVVCLNCFLPLVALAQNEENANEEEKLDAAQTAEMEEFAKGVFGGIGAALEIKDEMFVVKEALEGTPSARAGLSAGTVILAINDIPTKGMKLADVVRLIRGPVGTNVKLDIRDPSGEEKEIEITRENIEFAKPIATMPKPSMGMVRLTVINFETPKSLVKAVRNLQDQGAKGLLLDLRASPGGRLDAIKQVAELFLPKDAGLWLYEDKEGQRKLEKAAPSAERITLPLVVLIDKETVGTELLAAAIKRNKRGVLVGQRTSGKTASKRKIVNPDGTSTLVKNATFLMYPNKPISDVGVEPDVDLGPNVSSEEVLNAAIGELDKKLNAAKKTTPAGKKPGKE